METYGRETHFIPNGVNRPEVREAKLITDHFGLEKDSYILFLGRLVPEKGIRYLVEAFSGLVFQTLNWKMNYRYQCRGICRGQGNAKFLIFELDESRILTGKNQYIYGMFYRFGLIDMPDKVNGKMKRAGRQM